MRSSIMFKRCGFYDFFSMSHFMMQNFFAGVFVEKDLVLINSLASLFPYLNVSFVIAKDAK